MSMILRGAGDGSRESRILFDFFSESSGVTLGGRSLGGTAGGAWSISSGTWITDSSACRLNSVNADAIVQADAKRTDYVVSADIFVASTGGFFGGLVVRGDSDGRCILIEGEADDDISAYTRTSLGAYTGITSAAFNFTSGNTYNLSVSCASSNFEVSVNGSTLFSFASDFVGTSGPRVGLRIDTQTAGSTSNLFDNFLVKSL